MDRQHAVVRFCRKLSFCEATLDDPVRTGFFSLGTQNLYAGKSLGKTWFGGFLYVKFLILDLAWVTNPHRLCYDNPSWCLSSRADTDRYEAFRKEYGVPTCSG